MNQNIYNMENVMKEYEETQIEEEEKKAKRIQEFDREKEFDRIIEEITPISIPNSFIRGISVVMRNGSTVELNGDDLLSTLPLSGDFSWSDIAANFEAIEDVEILIDVPGLRQSVVDSVKNILKEHFDTYKDT